MDYDKEYSFHQTTKLKPSSADIRAYREKERQYEKQYEKEQFEKQYEKQKLQFEKQEQYEKDKKQYEEDKANFEKQLEQHQLYSNDDGRGGYSIFTTHNSPGGRIVEHHPPQSHQSHYSDSTQESKQQNYFSPSSDSDRLHQVALDVLSSYQQQPSQPVRPLTYDHQLAGGRSAPDVPDRQKGTVKVTAATPQQQQHQQQQSQQVQQKSMYQPVQFLQIDQPMFQPKPFEFRGKKSNAYA